ncbi:MAG: putative membrane protein YfcA [Kiritimatiellia bacterium]|jgi:uncharacterized protein
MTYPPGASPELFLPVFIGIAILVGFSKSGIPGIGILQVPLIALAVGDPRSSLGWLLPILIYGDVFAILFYRQHAQWRKIAELLPWIGLGLLAGWLGLRVIRPEIFGPVLGGLILSMVLIDTLRRRMDSERWEKHPIIAVFIGILTGFATTIGNAAGPVMNIYLIFRGFNKTAFLGSMGWLFLIINVLKIPIYAMENVISLEAFLSTLWMIPAVTLGAFAGRWLQPKVPQAAFNHIVIILTVLAAIKLCL